MNHFTPSRLDLVCLGRGLHWLYHLKPLKWKWIKCGKVFLWGLGLVILFGLASGGLVGYLTGAESIFVSALSGGILAALLAYLISIGMVAGLSLAVAPLCLSLHFEVVRSVALVFRAVERDRQYRPPRFVA